MRRSTRVAEFALALLACAAGCEVRGSVGLGFDPNLYAFSWADVQFGGRRDVDVLFVVDDSASMARKQDALLQALSTLTDQLDRLTPHHFHFGVITSDLGTGLTASGACAPLGDGALLVPRGRAAADDCVAPADRFVDFDLAGGSNLPPGRTLAQTLGCMISVGETGCSFGQPLEAAYQALSAGLPSNAGFLRDDAQLVVVFLTDGDDCSAPPDSPIFDPTARGFGPFDVFRCADAAITCPIPLTVGADQPIAGCGPRQNGPLYDLSRYRDFFFLPTGIKRNPNDVRLVVIAGPPNPVLVKSDPPPEWHLYPSCTAVGDANFAARPAVRLRALAAGSPRSNDASICAAGADEYALGTIAESLVSGDAVSPCLPTAIADPSQPECFVQSGGTTLPSCAATGGAPPCWELLTRPDCIPVENPRTREQDQLALFLRPPATVDMQVTARCRVISARR